jgi:hypothetical protein
MEYGFFDLTPDTTEEEFQSYLAEGIAEKKIQDEKAVEALRVAQELEREKQREIDRINLQHQREKSLRHVEFEPDGMDLASLTNEQFEAIYKPARDSYYERQEQERIAEQERVAERIRKEKEEQERVEQEKALAAAPDIVKLKLLAESFLNIELPTFSTEKGNAVREEVRVLLGKISSHINKRVEEF